MRKETTFAIYTHIQTIKALVCGCWALVKFTGVAALFLSPYIVVELVDRCDGRTQEQIEEFIKQNKVR
jgi:hypothetical protein